MSERKRNWKGQFVKKLRDTPEGSREWLIWSHYHNAWHRRDAETGGACGYTSDIAQAGLFPRSKADSYNDGDRNEAFHFSEKLPIIHAAIRQHNDAIERLVMLGNPMRTQGERENLAQKLKTTEESELTRRYTCPLKNVTFS